MKSFQDEFQCGLDGWIEFKDSKSFVGPNDFACLDSPSEAPGMAEPLRLGQIRLPALQLLGQLLVLSHIHWVPKSFSRPRSRQYEQQRTYRTSPSCRTMRLVISHPGASANMRFLMV